MSRVICRIGDSQCAARRGLLRIKSAGVASLHSTSVVGLWSSVVGIRRLSLVIRRRQYPAFPSEIDGYLFDPDQRPTTTTLDYPDALPSPGTPLCASVCCHLPRSLPSDAARPCNQTKSSDSSCLRACSGAA